MRLGNLFPVFSGRDTDFFVEYGNEIVVIGITALVGDFCNRKVGILGQQ